MAQCDLCGKGGQLLDVIIEGTQMRACGQCARFGTPVKVAARLAAAKKAVIKVRSIEPEIVVVSDFASRVRQLREKHGLTQGEFAKRIGERESLVPKLESGALSPSLSVVKKIEQAFHVALTELQDVDVAAQKGERRAVYTLGDFIRVKK